VRIHLGWHRRCLYEPLWDCGVPQPTEWQCIRNDLDAVMVLAWSNLANAHEDASSMVDETDPGQPFLRINILRWREIFRMIETSSSDVDLIGASVVLIVTRAESSFCSRAQD
jgi:hypothetical protein